MFELLARIRRFNDSAVRTWPAHAPTGVVGLGGISAGSALDQRWL